jgi:small ligand-binding sensory domain FIST
MKWCSVLSKPAIRDEEKLVEALANSCREALSELDGEKPDLVLTFVSPQLAKSYKKIGQTLHKLLSPQVLIGCSAGGLIGGGNEVEDESGIVISGAVFPGGELEAFHITDDQLPDLDAGPDRWEELVGMKGTDEPAFILLPEPFSFRIEALVEGLDFAFPRSAKIGGLASGADGPGKNVLFLNDGIHKRGAVGVAIAGNVTLETVVAQGCRPIGMPMRVSRCDHNILYDLDGKPALIVLRDLLESLSDSEQELAKNSLFLGLAMDEFKSSFGVGDFLIRNIVGIEPKSGALVIAEMLRNERTVQFHVRDAATSSEDLRLVLKRYVDNNSNGARREGALLFSCLGRGTYLYGSPNHDTDGFRAYLGEIPLSGFFCNGEIGPVSGTTFLHGYTSSFGIFKEKSPASVSEV